MSIFDDVFDDNYPSQILVDDVFDAEHYAGLFDKISILHQAITNQNWKDESPTEVAKGKHYMGKLLAVLNEVE